MRVKLIELPSAGNDTLSGAQRGKQVLAALITLITPTPTPSPVFIDFEGIVVATASFLNQVILGFRAYCASAKANLTPVVANITAGIREELAYLLTKENDAVMICTLDSNGPSNVEILGVLEEKQKLTLDLVRQLGEADAGILAAKLKKENIGLTAWNNRLAALAAKGLVFELRHGRSKSYKPVLEV